jgi:iron complex outermembrane receptor protein
MVPVTPKFKSKNTWKLRVLTLAIVQVSLTYAVSVQAADVQTDMQNAQSIAVDTDNVAHVVVKATTLTDPTTPAAGSSDNLNRTELDLQQAKTSDSAAALTSLTGVNTQTAGGISALPIFQGLADNRLRIMVDGVDSIASCPNHMNSPLSYVSPSAIKRAKIYSGVTPVSVSGNSIGSTIVVETAPPVFAKPAPKAKPRRTPIQVSNSASDGIDYQDDSATPVSSVMPANDSNLNTTATTAYTKKKQGVVDNQSTLAQSKSAAKPVSQTSQTNKSAKNIETSGEIGGYYRSNGDQVGANVTLTAASQNASITYKGSMAKADNYKAGGDFKNYTGTGNLGQSIAKDEVASTSFESQNQSLDLAYRQGNHLWQLGYNWQHIPEELYPNQRMDLVDNRLDRYNLRYSGDLAWGTLEAQVYHETVDHLMDFGSDKRFWYGMASTADPINFNSQPCSPIGTQACANGMPMYSQSETTGINLKAARQLSEKTNVRVGAEYQDYRLDDWWPASGGGMFPYTFQNIENGKRERMSVYGEWETEVRPDWTSLFGVRYENLQTQVDPVHGYNADTAPTALPVNGSAMTMPSQQIRDAAIFNNSDLSTTDHNWNVSLINRWQLSDTNDVELGLSRQQRSPSLYERYTWSTSNMMAGMNNTVGDGNGYVGNPNLKPETSNKIALTFDLRDKNDQWAVKLTPYFSLINDYVDAVQWDNVTNQPKATNTPDQYNVLRYVNQDARIFGADLAASKKLGATKWGEFDTTASLNYTHGKNTDTNSPLYNIMPFNAKLALNHQLNGWKNRIEWVGVSAKDRVSTPRNEIKTAGYGLLNLSTGYDWKNTNMTVGIDNVLDKKYALPLGGAYMGQGRTMSMNSELGTGISNWGTPVYGAGRSYFISLNHKF